MMNYKFWFYPLIFFILIVSGMYIYSRYQNYIFNQDYKRLMTLYQAKEYSLLIERANSLIDTYNVTTDKGKSLVKLRGLTYFELADYEKALLDIDQSIRMEGKVIYPLFYRRAIAKDYLGIADTSMICSDITTAINAKGQIISSRKLELDYLDSTNVFDISYLDMLKLRVKYCSALMPNYTKLDKELILRNNN